MVKNCLIQKQGLRWEGQMPSHAVKKPSGWVSLSLLVHFYLCNKSDVPSKTIEL